MPFKVYHTSNQYYGQDVFDKVVWQEKPVLVLTIGDSWMCDYIANPNICRTRRSFLWCFSEDTEVVTKTGFKNIKDVSIGEDVISINPETKEVSFTKSPLFWVLVGILNIAVIGGIGFGIAKIFVKKP